MYSFFSGPTHSHAHTHFGHLCVKSVCECVWVCVWERERGVFIFHPVLWRRVCVCVCDIDVLQNAFKVAPLTEDYCNSALTNACYLYRMIYRGCSFSQTYDDFSLSMRPHEHGCGIFSGDFFLWALTALVMSQLVSVCVCTCFVTDLWPSDV
jgi:hypothetical protein